MGRAFFLGGRKNERKLKMSSTFPPVSPSSPIFPSFFYLFSASVHISPFIPISPCFPLFPLVFPIFPSPVLSAWRTGL